MNFPGIVFDHTPKGKLYAVSKYMWQKYQAKDPMAVSYVKGLIRKTDEN